jgi:hypothetical protein
MEPKYSLYLSDITETLNIDVSNYETHHNDYSMLSYSHALKKNYGQSSNKRIAHSSHKGE